MSDHDHWLWRLSDHDWIDAAHRELEQAREHLGTRRTAITHARRAAGMALNGVLVSMAGRGWARSHCESAWGRSYMDHLRAAADPSLAPMFDFEQAERCRTLLAVPVMPPTGLIRLATRKDEAASQAVGLATAIVEACRDAVGRPQSQTDPTKPGV